MTGETAEEAYWAAIRQQTGERCAFYSAEELAQFAEGGMRGRNARALAGHLEVCRQCREVVHELRRELAPEPVTVRVRPRAARGWQWALAACAAAAVVVAVVCWRPGKAVAPGPQSSPGVGATLAHRPAATPKSPPGEQEGPETVAPKASAQPAAPTATAGTAGTTKPERPKAVHHRKRTRQAPPRPASAHEPEGEVLEGPILAFGPAEPAAPATPEAEELLRSGAVNDLPKAATEDLLDEGLVTELYRGLRDLQQDMPMSAEGEDLR